MLSLTKKTEYALIAIYYLADRRPETVSAREITEAFNMPGALVMNILKTLHHNDLLSSTRGTKGGYNLTADLGKITLYDLIAILEGPVRLTECSGVANPAALVDRNCKVHPGCPIQKPIHALHNRVVAFLKEVKLSELLGLRGQGGGSHAHAYSIAVR